MSIWNYLLVNLKICHPEAEEIVTNKVSYLKREVFIIHVWNGHFPQKRPASSPWNIIYFLKRNVPITSKRTIEVNAAFTKRNCDSKNSIKKIFSINKNQLLEKRKFIFSKEKMKKWVQTFKTALYILRNNWQTNQHYHPKQQHRVDEVKAQNVIGWKGLPEFI